MKKKYKNNLISCLNVFILILIVLSSSSIWFFWSAPNSLLLYLMFIISQLLYLRNKNFKTISVSPVVIILWFLFIYWYAFIKNTDIKAAFGFTLMQLPLLLLLLMDYRSKLKFLRYTITIFGFIIGISIIWYILFILGIELPNFDIQHPDDYRSYRCFYGFVMFKDLNAFRFCSVFKEPGHLGTFCALFLYIEKYDFKNWKCIVFLIAILFSLSLSGYVLLVIGWIIYRLAEKKSLRPLIVGIFTAGILTIIVDRVVTINGEGIVSIMILDRTKINKEKGIEGNSRTSEKFDNFYKSVSLIDLILGLNGTNNVRYNSIINSDGNNGYKYVILSNGIIGFLLIIILFFMIVKTTPSRLGYGMFWLYLLSYLQRVYLLWPIESYIYIAAAAVFFHQKKTHSKALKTIKRIAPISSNIEYA